MTEYIERKAAIACIDKLSEGMTYLDITTESVIGGIKELPAADVRPVVRGRWIDDKGNPVPWDEMNKECPAGSCSCSVCGDWLTASDEYPVRGNFCPNCGADMRGEEDGKEK